MRRALTAILLSLAAATATFAPATASAERSSVEDLSVGTLLTAMNEVTLHQAVIAKGSKVSVFGVSRRKGHVSSVDVQLADGHVVPRVDIAMIRTSFRVSAE